MKLFSKVVLTMSVLYALTISPLGRLASNGAVTEGEFRRYTDGRMNNDKNAGGYRYPDATGMIIFSVVTLGMSMIHGGRWEDIFVVVQFAIIASDAAFFFGQGDLSRFSHRFLTVTLNVYCVAFLGVVGYVFVKNIRAKVCASDSKHKGNDPEKVVSSENRAMLIASTD
ncbi:hypothetical protein AAVH_17273 [Aphelenchoides avenae]|nr:hypothetical protein AAVH_17273 [Aphelenchus avenae]